MPAESTYLFLYVSTVTEFKGCFLLVWWVYIHIRYVYISAIRR